METASELYRAAALFRTADAAASEAMEHLENALEAMKYRRRDDPTRLAASEVLVKLARFPGIEATLGMASEKLLELAQRERK